MLFNSWEFLILFVPVFGAYLLLGLRGQNWLLLVSSYVFYGWWDWRFLGLLIASSVIDFALSNRMVTASAEGKQRLLTASLVANLGILGFFKYFNFFLDSAVRAGAAFGLALDTPALHIILPVGISFYTFQTMAYTIDVYRGRLEPCRDPVVFGVYVAFFPQLVAGPIERAQALLPQFSRPRELAPAGFASGLLLVMIGLVRKCAIADVVGSQVDEIFHAPGSASSEALFRGCLLFGLQIYGDFAGYSDMARGLSRMLGVELMENFNHPYFSRNITVFWRRWHISLSTWLRDYLYVPLGGNRGGKFATYRNLMLTMLLGGLWHGAAWTFVVWGGIHGVALALHKVWLRGRDPDRPSSRFWALCSWAFTMLVVGLAWVFFRAPDLASAMEILGGILSLRGPVSPSNWIEPAGLVALMMVIDAPQHLRREHTVFLSWPWLPRALFYLLLVFCLLLLAPAEETPFLYFQF